MICGFSTYTTGAAKGPIVYLTAPTNPDGTQRRPAPVVLRGDSALIGALIDSLDFERKYTSGVLSFAPGEVITPEMEQAIMRSFEEVAFAGLAPDRYGILWVRHTHAGHHELNYLVPRVELSTGKSLNIHPPGQASKAMFDTFRSMINAEYGLSDPEDPSRARSLKLPQHIAKIRASATRRGDLKQDIREAITEYVRREVDAGRIKDRADVEAYLKAQDYKLTRTGKDYISVEVDKDAADPRLRAIRLKGGLYSVANFNPRETATQGISPFALRASGDKRYGTPDPERAAELAAQLAPMTEARARFNRARYGTDDSRPPRQVDRSQEPEDRHQGSGVRGQEPGVSSQGPEARGQEPEARNQGSGVRGKEPEPAPHSATPEPLSEYLQRTLGAEALPPTGRARRARIRAAARELPPGQGKRGATPHRADRRRGPTPAAGVDQQDLEWWQRYLGTDEEGLER